MSASKTFRRYARTKRAGALKIGGRQQKRISSSGEGLAVAAATWFFRALGVREIVSMPAKAVYIKQFVALIDAVGETK